MWTEHSPAPAAGQYTITLPISMHLLDTTRAVFSSTAAILIAAKAVFKLRDELRGRQVVRFSVAMWSSADMSRMGLPDFNVLQPSHPVSGWVAISDRSRLEGQLFHISYPVNAFAWLSRYSPVARVGRTINLYHIPETDHQMSANDGGFETPAHPRAN